MSAEIVQLPVRYAPVQPEDLFDELMCRIARLERIERTAAAFVEHVEARSAAGWHKVPRRPTQHGETGFDQLLEALEGER